MTVNERAVELCKEILYGDPDPRTVFTMAAAMTEAVAEAYQTCARIAENAEKVGMGHAEIAATIRARVPTHPTPSPATNPPANKEQCESCERVLPVTKVYGRFFLSGV